LADYYIRQGLFERARDVYQEGVESVITVRDFTLIFEALTSFEQALIEAQMEQLGDDISDEKAEPEGDGADFLLTDDGMDIDLRLERLEWLYSERPKLLSSVMLRQNPHNVAVCCCSCYELPEIAMLCCGPREAAVFADCSQRLLRQNQWRTDVVQEWHNRVHLFEGDLQQQIQTYTEAVKTVDPDKAVGKPHTLWCAFAHFYERHQDLDNARAVFEKATEVRPAL
jgi:pre-mRNA-splicing factor SYF1